MTERVVLDASAIVAVVLKEPGMDKVVPALSFACTSAINRTEALYIVAKRLNLSSLDEARERVDPLEIEVISFDQEQSSLAADIHIHSRKLGLSVGDCSCLALAKTKNIPVLTSDRVWTKLDIGVHVRMIR